MRACWKGELDVIFALLNHSPGVYLNVQNKVTVVTVWMYLLVRRLKVLL